MMRRAFQTLRRLPHRPWRAASRSFRLARAVVRGAQPESEGPRTVEDLPRWLEQYPLLYVDDQPDSLLLAQVLFERSGLSLITTLYPHDAWTICQHVPLSLVISNIMMPEMDGYQLCGALKADPGVRHLPVVFFTVLVMPRNILMGFELGAVSYLCKPVSPPLLAPVIIDLLLAHGNWKVGAPHPHREMIERLTRRTENHPGTVSMIDPPLRGAHPAWALRDGQQMPLSPYRPASSYKFHYTPADIPSLKAAASRQR